MAHRRKKRKIVPVKIENQQKTTFMQRVAKVMELPIDLVSGMSHMELSGNREAVVDGCTSVLEFDENIVRLSVGKYIIRFNGRGLTLKELTKNSVVVEGFITSIEFVNV
jgi:sporulation protein YqfC